MRTHVIGFVLVFGMTTVASTAELFVAPNGDDANPGSAQKPFRTIQRAADVMKAGDVCRVRGGVYRETVTIEESGEKGRPIRFAAHRGDTVTLSGTEPIKANWSVHKGRIYKAIIDRDVTQLFVDAEMMVEARWPNQPFEKRWDKTTWGTTAEGSDYGKIVDSELGKTGVDWTGAMAVLNVGAWQTFLRPVQNHAAGKSSFEYAKDMGRRHNSEQTRRKRQRPGFDRYFLFGKLEALDAPCEWFLDREARILYLWPPDGENPSDRRIEGKVREYAFLLKNKNHVRIDGFNLFGATVLLENANDCLVENCRLNYPTYVGPAVKQDGSTPYVTRESRRTNEMFLGGVRALVPTLIDGRRNVVRNCSIAFSEAPALLVTGSDNTIENCLIHDIDWRGLGNGVVGNCAAVHMAASAKSVFRRNTIHHVGSSEGVVLPSMGPSVCEYNYIHHGGMVQSDGGLLQCNGIRLNGTVIRYNWVHDHHAFNWGGIGIRGDDLTRNLLIHHNVAWNCDEKGIMMKGDRNQAYNNTCFDNPMLDMVLWAAGEPLKEWAPRQWPHLLKQQNANTTACNNYAPVLTGQMPHEVRRARRIEPPLGELSHNLGAEAAMLVDPKKVTFRKASPPLVAPAAFDFRPQKGSPLVDAGRTVDGITDGHIGKAPDVGAYEYGDEHYWIPGRREAQASTPIPPDGWRNSKPTADLMWLGAYRSLAHDVYFGSDEAGVATANRKSSQFRGNRSNNIVHPGVLKPESTYYWRIDGVMPNGEVVRGDVWRFTVGVDAVTK